MACLLKLPGPGSRGVLTVTTQERDKVIRADDALAQRLAALKDRWVVGLHHNWHDHAFRYDPLYDFSMAGEDDLREVDGRPFARIGLDACNFVPDAFVPGPWTSGEPFWDILYVARPVAFKGFPTFLESVRLLFDEGRAPRVLCLAPMPPYVRSDRSTVMYDVRERYTQMFSQAERERFTLWVIERDYPFPLDLATLAHFYRSTRVFAHFAPEERRCRVAGYAWACGLPVVASEAVASLLPDHLRQQPSIFEVDPPGSATRFAQRLSEAIDATRGPVPATAELRGEFSESETRGRLRREIASIAPDVAGDGAWALDGLSLRLGRHLGISLGTNRVPLGLPRLVDALERDDPALAVSMGHPDPEQALADALGHDPPPTRGRWRLRAP